MDINLNVNVPAIEKLVDYTASGIGSVAGPMLAPWKARRESEAKLIATKGEADSLKTIAEAQSEARKSLVSQDVNFTGELDITNTIKQRIQFQEEKKQRNIGSVVKQSALQLGDKNVADSEPDHDWIAGSSTRYRTCHRKKCNCCGRKCSPAKLNEKGVRPFER